MDNNEIDFVLKTIKWYEEIANSCASFDHKKPELFGQKILAIFTELSLDGGKRAKEAVKILNKYGENNGEH